MESWKCLTLDGNGCSNWSRVVQEPGFSPTLNHLKSTVIPAQGTNWTLHIGINNQKLKVLSENNVIGINLPDSNGKAVDVIDDEIFVLTSNGVYKNILTFNSSLGKWGLGSWQQLEYNNNGTMTPIPGKSDGKEIYALKLSNGGYQLIISYGSNTSRTVDAYVVPVVVPTSTPTNTLTPTPVPPLGDFDQDYDVDELDYNLMVGTYFGQTGGPGDLDKDSQVGIFDFNILVGNFTGPLP
jgi:hypothetical protein